jgi:hypothetical protein
VALSRLPFVWLTRRALEGVVEPSKGDKYLFYVYTGLHRDVRPARTIFSVAVKPCAAIPAVAAPLRTLQQHP